MASGCGPAGDSPDPSTVGPYATTSSEYRFPPAIDTEVLPGVTTEVWGAVYRPTTLGNHHHPLLVFLHGNHPTCGVGTNPRVDTSCEYTFDGTCPTGQVVVPNHLGYEYLATRLASWGYIVVSINANRGITCGTPVTGDNGLNLARGRLVLRHLALLAQWNRQGGTPSSLGFDMTGQLDLQHVGLMGHSRGGEGVRAAYNLYKDAGSTWPAEIKDPMIVRGIFEIGPVDGQTSRTLDAAGTAWNVLLPMCDGDVADLEGMKPYDRMSKDLNETPAFPKSMFAVWGANHDFYNTQWQVNDSPGCVGMKPLWATAQAGSVPEQDTALVSALGFFRSYVGEQVTTTFAQTFDPQFALPAWLTQITRVDRTFSASPNSRYTFQADTFNGATGTDSLNQPEDSVGLTGSHVGIIEHDPSFHAVDLIWNSAGPNTYFQDNWVAAGQGLDLTRYETLDFRISRANNPLLNGVVDTDFEVQLVNNDGTLTAAMPIALYASITGPVGTPKVLHETLQTVRIPLADFNSPKSARAVRFTFNSTATGDLFVADIGLSAKGSEPWSGTLPQLAPTPATPIATTKSLLLSSVLSSAVTAPLGGPMAATAPMSKSSNKIVRLERRTRGDTFVELEVESSEPFAVRDALPVLVAQGQPVAVGFIPTTGDTRHMIFRVEDANMAALPDGFAVTIGHREDPHGELRDLGKLHKANWPGKR